MAFKAYSKEKRTYDEERRLEFVQDRITTQGEFHFGFYSLDDPEDRLGGFWTDMAKEGEHYGWAPFRGGAPAKFPLRGYSEEESLEIIREALTAYRQLHGMPETNDAYFVDFSKFK